MYSVYGIGNPLLDMIVHADFRIVEEMHVKPGTMNLIDRDQMQKLLQFFSISDCLVDVASLQDVPLSSPKAVQVPGGSCANTIRGIAWLSSFHHVDPPVYCGSVGQDSYGKKYMSCLERFGVHLWISQKAHPTGVSIIIVTPDFERTMFTFLGACREFQQNDISRKYLKLSKCLHVTGYMWDTKNQEKAVKQGVEYAHEFGLTISFDLADPFVVTRNRTEFLEWIPGTVDILLGNRDELELLVGKQNRDKDTIGRAGRLAETVVMKVGREGSYVAHDGTIEKIPGKFVAAVDTTGAGDSFAAGFLFGILTGKSPQSAASLANYLAAEIVAVEGCDFDQVKWEELPVNDF